MIALEAKMANACPCCSPSSFVVNLDPQAGTLEVADNVGEARLFMNEDEAAAWWHQQVSQMATPPQVMVRTFEPTLQ